MDREVQFLLYNMPEDSGKVQVVIKDETIWCTQKAMAQLFGVGVPAVSKHLKNIFEEGELSPEMTISKMETVINRGKRGEVNEFIDFYNLDAIIAVGYRVSSLKATRFRQWATTILNEYIRKGFAMDDERLKQGTALFGKDYFRELLERVRSIRASERRIWQQITDIYAECSIDYDRNAKTTRDFYAMVQNRFHYAITGQTAAEIIYSNSRPHERAYGNDNLEECSGRTSLEIRCKHCKELPSGKGNPAVGTHCGRLFRLYRRSYRARKHFQYGAIRFQHQ